MMAVSDQAVEDYSQTCKEVDTYSKLHESHKEMY